MNKIEIRELDQKTWEDFIKTQEFQIFTQSWHYGQFNKLLKDDFFVLGIYEKDKLVGGSLYVVISARRGKFLYAPYCPIIDTQKPEHLIELTKEARKMAKRKGAIFIRVSPFIDDSDHSRKLFQKANYRKSPIHITAETTWILDLNKEEDQLLKDMRQNHRNLIRRADRENVEIKTSTDPKDIKLVHDLLEETAKRHNFVPFPLNYLQKEFEAYSKIDAVKIYFAYHEGDLLAANIVFFYGNSAIYRHGASNQLKPKIPAAYALQWAAIKEAKQRKMKYYNFWGIAPEGQVKHPFYGITTFKKGFGGFQKDLLPAHDLIVSKKYWLTFLIETFRRIKRGF